MLRRITKLKNVGRFADLRCRGGTETDFAKVNVVYAANACGKTTLCDVLRSLGTGNPDFVLGRKRFSSAAAIEIEILFSGTPTPRAVFAPAGWQLQPPGSAMQKVFVYDDRFVAENVLVGQSIAVEQRRNIYGLALGAQGQALKQAVDQADRELGEATTAVNLARTRLGALIPGGFSIETFRHLTRDDAIDQRIKEVAESLETAKRTKRIADAIRARRPMATVVAPAVPAGLSQVLAATLDAAAVDAEAMVRQHMARHGRGLNVDWFSQGFRAQNGTICPHCGQDMHGSDILAAYRAFFSGVLQQQQDLMRAVSEEVEQKFGPLAQQRISQVFESHTVERDWWRDAGGSPFTLPAGPGVATVTHAMEEVRSTVAGVLTRKRAQPGHLITPTTTEEEALARWRDIVASIASYMIGIPALNATIAERQRSAGTVDVAPIERLLGSLNAQSKRHEKEVIDAYTAFDDAIARKAEKERAKVSANNALRGQSEQVLSEYGARINALLDRFQVGFRLVSGGVNFHGGPPAGDLAVEILGTRVSTTPEDARTPARPSLGNTLSGGDRSALGLAFFVAVAERDPNLSNTIIVFDDPFHSQDRSRRRRTLECVHRLASASQQCFILSHELDFALEAVRMPGASVKSYTLDPMNDHSLLEAKALPPLPGRAYEQDYAKLTAYLRNPAEFVNHRKDVARSIRQCLEGYLRTKFPESWDATDWLGDMINKIRNAQPGNVLHLARHLEADLTEVNEWGKRYYHAETDGSDAGTVDATELRSYVDQTLGIISR